MARRAVGRCVAAGGAVHRIAIDVRPATRPSGQQRHHDTTNGHSRRTRGHSDMRACLCRLSTSVRAARPSYNRSICGRGRAARPPVREALRRARARVEWRPPPRSCRSRSSSARRRRIATRRWLRDARAPPRLPRDATRRRAPPDRPAHRRVRASPRRVARRGGRGAVAIAETSRKTCPYYHAPVRSPCTPSVSAAALDSKTMSAYASRISLRLKT